jgi:tRNA(Ile)-lysidine synthase
MQPHELKELKNLLAPANRIVVGVSGGVDSMVLLDILHRNREYFQKEFKVLHVDHQINPESANWAKFVKDYCNTNSIECEIAAVDISKFGNNIERAARQARYEAFAAQKAEMIILAHHADDQCETFFLKLFRGSGLKGLRCMNKVGPSWIDPNVTLLRPLLTWNKDRIKNHAEDYRVPNIEDLSNNDVRFDRNWIRHELWPTVMRRNEIADINLQRSIALISEGWELTQDLAEIDFNNCKNPDGSLDWRRVILLSKPRVKNLILHILDQNNITGFSTHHVEDFVKSLNTADLDSKNELKVKGFVMRKTGKKIVFENEFC